MTNDFKFTNAVRLVGIAADGSRRIRVGFNTLTFAAADVMIAALLQSGPSKVTYLYAQHGGSSTDPDFPPVVLPSDLRETTQADLTATESTYNSGGLWIPLLAAPAADTTDTTSYTGNVATYYFRIPGTPAAGSYTGVFVPGTSRIYSLGLGVTVNTNDRSQDKIISVLAGDSFTPFIIAANGQEAVDYPMQITIPAV